MAASIQLEPIPQPPGRPLIGNLPDPDADPFRERTGGSAADAQAWLAGMRSSRHYLEDSRTSAT